MQCGYPIYHELDLVKPHVWESGYPSVHNSYRVYIDSTLDAKLNQFIDFKNRTAVIPVMQDRDPSAALDVGLAYPKVP
jgi:hypothetical protein